MPAAGNTRNNPEPHQAPSDSVRFLKFCLLGSLRPIRFLQIAPPVLSGPLNSPWVPSDHSSVLSGFLNCPQPCQVPQVSSPSRSVIMASCLFLSLARLLDFSSSSVRLVVNSAILSSSSFFSCGWVQCE